MGIKNSLLKQASFYEYIWEIIACMVITGKGRLSVEIWPETSNQSTSSEDMILSTWYNGAMKQKEINLQQHYPSSPTAKDKACYLSYTSFN